MESSARRQVLGAYRLVCLLGSAAALTYFALADGPITALLAVFPCFAAVLLTYPWLPPAQSDARARRHILWLIAGAAISSAVWTPAWWGLGFVLAPAAVLALLGYAFAVRAAVRQAAQPWDLTSQP
ncbi:hypothetical protein [Nocardia sp. NPDC050435]|uniref:hypothetical protein n=1 Tax=Nocardia sp. NPDC050435 TaxID=3155040 RepID=UPI0033D2487B